MFNKEINSPSSLTKEHFKILDGLRGVAAVAVVIFHFMEIAVPDYHDSFIAHAYLAVDFFFCLSGFVIAYSYDQRMQKIGKLAFLKLRFIRLHPLVIFGSIIGLLAFVFDPFSNLYQKYSGELLAMFLASCCMIPYPLVHERYFNLFHLNPPTWSLFWEYIANVFYAFIFVRIRNKLLWVLTATAALLLLYEAHTSGNLGVGWSGDNFWGGGIRVFYSFLAGILVYRSHWVIHSRIGFITTGLLLMAVFLIPFSERYNPIVEPLVVTFFFPFLIVLSIGGRLKPYLIQFCDFAGNISYPLYMIHYPFIWLFMSYVELKKPSMSKMIWVMVLGVLLLVLLAYLVSLLLDSPMRKWLKKKLT